MSSLCYNYMRLKLRTLFLLVLLTALSLQVYLCSDYMYESSKGYWKHSYRYRYYKEQAILVYWACDEEKYPIPIWQISHVRRPHVYELVWNNHPGIGLCPPGKWIYGPDWK